MVLDLCATNGVQVNGIHHTLTTLLHPQQTHDAGYAGTRGVFPLLGTHAANLELPRCVRRQLRASWLRLSSSWGYQCVPNGY